MGYKENANDVITGSILLLIGFYLGIMNYIDLLFIFVALLFLGLFRFKKMKGGKNVRKPKTKTSK